MIVGTSVVLIGLFFRLAAWQVTVLKKSTLGPACFAILKNASSPKAPYFGLSEMNYSNVTASSVETQTLTELWLRS